MNNKLIPIVLTLVVGTILAGSVLMPVLNDATTTERTFVNEGAFNYGIFTPDDEYTLTYTQATGELIVNDVVVPSFDALNKAYSIVATDNYLARYGYNSGGYYLQHIGYVGNNLFADGGVTATITISGGDLSITWVKADNTTVTKTVTFTEMYAIVPTADAAVMKAAADQVYIKGDSELYASGLTTITNWTNIFHFEGTYNDGITISSPSFPDATYDNITWNIEPVAGYVDLYKLTSIEFDITNNDTVTHATYSYFGVPSEVTAELSQHLTPGQIALVSAVPVLVIVALLVVAVGIVARRND